MRQAPAGRMHLGGLSLLPAGVAFGQKRRQQGCLCRIEDLDAVQRRAKFADLLEADLAWLGLAADEGSKGGPRGLLPERARRLSMKNITKSWCAKGWFTPAFAASDQRTPPMPPPLRWECGIRRDLPEPDAGRDRSAHRRAQAAVERWR